MSLANGSLLLARGDWGQARPALGVRELPPILGFLDGPLSHEGPEEKWGMNQTPLVHSEHMNQCHGKREMHANPQNCQRMPSVHPEGETGTR